MISFNGSYIRSLTVLQKDKNGKFDETTESFVKLDPMQVNDVEALGKAVAKWNSSKFIASYIVQSMANTCLLCSDYGFETESDYYIATSQMEDFDNLDPNKIRGAIQVWDTGNKEFIEHFEVAPEYSVNNVNRTIKNVGKAMLNAVKEIYKKKDITANPTSEAFDFYIGEGFEKKSPTNNCVIYKRNK